MANSFKVGTFNKSTGAASVDQSVTDVGFTPKALILYCTAETAEGFQADLSFSIGMTSGASNSQSQSAWSDDAVATTACAKRQAAKALTITLVSGGGSAVAECDLKTFDSNGFTLTWTTNNASAYKIHYIAFGGPDITNATVQKPTIQIGTGNKSYTGIGFQPDIMFMCFNGVSAGGSSSMGSGFGVGISATKRWALAMSSTGGTNMTALVDAVTYQRADSILLSTSNAAEQNRYDLVSMDADGFTLNQIAQASTIAFNVLCIKGGNWDVGSFVKSTSAAAVDQSVASLAFAPDGYILAGGKNVTATSSVVVNANFALGASDGTNEITAWCEQLDANLTSCDSSIVSTKVFRNAAGPSTIKSEADHKTLNSDGFTITWTTNDTVNNPTILWVAAKLSAPAVVEPALIGRPDGASGQRQMNQLLAQ
jgi:hypothetical protein